MSIASHAGVFRGGREKRAPLKTPAWEATMSTDVQAPHLGRGERLEHSIPWGD